MHRDGWKSTLVWFTLTAAVSMAIASDGLRNLSFLRKPTRPGHEASLCGNDQAHDIPLGTALPDELGEDNVRCTYPVDKSRLATDQFSIIHDRFLIIND